MNSFALYPLYVIGTILFYFGLWSLMYFPLALGYLLWERRLLARPECTQYTPRVSVIIPAYNEERTIVACVQAILESDYPDLEIIVVNDGSTDATNSLLRPFEEDGRIRYLAKENGGKASALNAGAALASGDIILFSDADAFFEKDTVRNGVAYFSDPAIGAVSGNDCPRQPQGLLQKLLVITTHIGTGYVRRALSLARVLPIIPGNMGYIRASILRDVGGFREIWGEDLELTLRLYRHRVRVVYGARTRVLAECPNTLRDLWRQRVRWMRSYIKILRMNRDMIARPRYGLFSFFLLLNAGNMLVVPTLQLLMLPAMPFLIHAGVIHVYGVAWVAYLGLWSLLGSAVISILLDRSPRDFQYLPYLLLLVPLSYFYSAVVLYSIVSELRATPEQWQTPSRRTDDAVLAGGVASPYRRRLVLGGLALACLAFTARSQRVADTKISLLAAQQPMAKPQMGGNLTVSTHFSDWPDWRDAYRSILKTAGSQRANWIALSAGRPDWAFFRWHKHQWWWSPEQTEANVDMLSKGMKVLSNRGYKVMTILDVLAPRYLEQNPQFAALDPQGHASKDVVCLSCLVNGDYGDLLDSAFLGLANRKRVHTICLTEMFYDNHCYDERCRTAFLEASGLKDWPRRADGSIDTQHSGLTRWRSTQVAKVVGRLSSIARKHNKRFLVDVRISRDNLANNSRENGQDYDLLLPLVDQLVVWDYFALEQRPPEESRRVAEYLNHKLGAKRYWHSIGLWDAHGGIIDAESMMRAIQAAREGGSENVWIVPGRGLTPYHWAAIAALKLGRDYAHPAGTKMQPIARPGEPPSGNHGPAPKPVYAIRKSP